MCLTLQSPELDTAVQMCLTSAEESGRITSLNLLVMHLAQGTIGHLCCKGTLFTLDQLATHQDPTRTPRCLSYRAPFQPASPQPILMPGVIPPQVQDLTLPLAELHKILVCSVLQAVKACLSR